MRAALESMVTRNIKIVPGAIYIVMQGAGAALATAVLYLALRDGVGNGTDFGANAIVRFDPASEQFDSFPLPSAPGNVRQLLGRPGELWGAESAADQLVVIRY